MTAFAELGERLDLPLAVRVGLDAGPVVAGVVGRSRFGYDLWGEAVNLASRMESTGLPGRVQVTRRVQESLADRFRFTARGPIFVKGCDELETWFLEG